MGNKNNSISTVSINLISGVLLNSVTTCVLMLYTATAQEQQPLIQPTSTEINCIIMVYYRRLMFTGLCTSSNSYSCVFRYRVPVSRPIAQMVLTHSTIPPSLYLTMFSPSWYSGSFRGHGSRNAIHGNLAIDNNLAMCQQ